MKAKQSTNTQLLVQNKTMQVLEELKLDVSGCFEQMKQGQMKGKVCIMIACKVIPKKKHDLILVNGWFKYKTDQEL